MRRSKRARGADREVEDLWSRMSPSEVAARYEALLAVTDSILDHVRLNDTLHRLTERIRTAMGAHSATVLLNDGGPEPGLRVRATCFADGPGAPVGTRITEGLAPRAAQQRIGFILNNPPPAERQAPLLLGIGCAMAAPLMLDGAVIGVIHVGAREEDAFGYVDLHFLELLANRVAVALDHARDQDESAGRAKGNFLAIMSHELRTPLNSIIGYSELLEDQIVGALNEVQREHLERIRESGWHLLELINQILSISRIESDQEEVSFEFIDAEQHAVAATDQVRSDAERKGLGLRVDAPADPLIFSTDPRRLHRILLNLLSNAVKFTREGEISLTIREENDQILFRVRDTGIGIEPHHLESVFEPFWQADQSNTRLAGGTGLGLQVAQSQATLIGGDIRVESEPRTGSTFTLSLPTSKGPTITSTERSENGS